MIQIGNEAPIGDIIDQSIFAFGTLDIDIAGSYTDSNGDFLSYSITQTDGSDLPSWISFDGSSLSGTPTSEDLGITSLTVTVDDNFGGILEDTFNVSVTTNIVNGTVNSDTLRGTNFSDEIYGMEADDTLRGFGGDDTLDGGTGNDLLLGGGGNDFLTATSGNNRMLGQHGNDFLQGGREADTLLGGKDDDTLWGGSGDDRMIGQDGNDKLLGGNGSDIMFGGNHNDFLNGSVGDDLLFGNAGDDTLIGGQGKDKLKGGSGADTFTISPDDALGTILDLDDMDIIVDFNINDDQIRLTGGLGFSDLSINQHGGSTLIEANGVSLALLVKTDAELINNPELFG